MDIPKIKQLALTLGNLGFPTELLAKSIAKVGGMSYMFISFDLLDGTTIHIEALDGVLGSSFIMMREVSDPLQKQVLIKGDLSESRLDEISFQIAGLMIRF